MYIHIYPSMYLIYLSVYLYIYIYTSIYLYFDLSTYLYRYNYMSFTDISRTSPTYAMYSPENDRSASSHSPSSPASGQRERVRVRGRPELSPVSFGVNCPLAPRVNQRKSNQLFRVKGLTLN